MFRSLRSHTLFTGRSLSSNASRESFLWRPQRFTKPVKVWSSDIFAILINRAAFAPHFNSDCKGNSDTKNLLMLLSNTKKDIGSESDLLHNVWVNPEHSHEVVRSLPYIRYALGCRFPEIKVYSTAVEAMLNEIEELFFNEKKMLDSKPSDLNRKISSIIGNLIQKQLSDDINFINLSSYTDTELNQSKIGKLILPEVERQFGKILLLKPFSNNEIEKADMNALYPEKAIEDTNVFSCHR